MKTAILTSLLLLVPHSMLTMVAKKQICHLARLPHDIQNMIAGYLAFRNIETEKDFIFRTEIKSHCVSDYHRDAQQYRRPDGCFSAYSPDNLKKAYLIHCDQYRATKVVVSDTIPRKESEPQVLDQVASAIYEDKEYNQTVDVAISSDGQLFGRLAQHKVVNVFSGEVIADCNRVQISVIDISSGVKRDFPIPMLLKSVVFLDFNKQGTKIITHGICYEKEERTWSMWNLVTEKEHVAKCKKTLAEYLRQKGICKNLKNSL